MSNVCGVWGCFLTYTMHGAGCSRVLARGALLCLSHISLGGACIFYLKYHYSLAHCSLSFSLITLEKYKQLKYAQYPIWHLAGCRFQSIIPLWTSAGILRSCANVCVCVSRHIFEINRLIEIRDGLALMSCSEELFSTYFISLFSNQTHTLCMLRKWAFTLFFHSLHHLGSYFRTWCCTPWSTSHQCY